MVEFPKPSKGHMVIETIGSDTAKGQSSFKNTGFCTILIKYHDKLAGITLWTSPYWSQLGCCFFFWLSMQPFCLLTTIIMSDGFTLMISIANLRDKIRDKTTLNCDKFNGQL